MKKAILNRLSLILLIGSISSFYVLPTLSGLTKEEQWHQVAQEVDTWADGLGLPIDAGIKRTVTILNLLGCTTIQSCEGHIDWGCPYPWVDFDTQDGTIETLENQRDALGERIDKIERENIDDEEKLEELYQEGRELAVLYRELRTIGDTIRKTELLKLMPLKKLLNIFYKDHPTDHDRILTIKWDSRLQSIGADWQVTRNDKQKLEKMHEYQEEMRLFTDFLIEHWKHS